MSASFTSPTTSSLRRIHPNRPGPAHVGAVDGLRIPVAASPETDIR
ncbi:MAG: hypothetical protein H6686_11990 [Fibrobacteria bacterium]|nr:hypothetical protein [Fibrobacteria bacterium]